MGRYDLIERKRSWGPIFTILIVLLILGAGVWLYYKPQPTDDSGIKTQELLVPNVSEQPPATVAAPPEHEDALPEGEEGAQTTEGGTGEPQVDMAATLPALENSDGLFREKVTELSPGLAVWLNTDDLIRKTIVIINDFSQGQRLYKHMQSFKLNEPFIADQDEQGFYITRKSYQRYNALASAIDAIKVPAALEFYKTIKPLCQQVFAEFNYPNDYHIDDVINKAAAEILAAPVIEARIDLVRTSVNYNFADKELEALSPVHKQMIRMGPQNTRIIQNKLRLLLEALVNLDD